MRNYPLLKKQNIIDTERNWQKTYVDFLVTTEKSLIDYSNYFLADYRLGPAFILLGSYSGFNCYSIENLRYHQYRNTEEEAYFFLKASDWPDHSVDPLTRGAKKIRAGRQIINNNQRESELDTYKDWENIVIQPISYTAFYVMNFANAKFNFLYTKNAQLYYGTEQSISPMNFDTRFFYYNPNYAGTFSNIEHDKPNVEVSAESYKSTPDSINWGIQDLQDFYWTDITFNPVMGFTFKKSSASDTSLGEEIIIDTTITWEIKVDKTSSAVYNMTAKGGLAGTDKDFYAPNTVLYFL